MQKLFDEVNSLDKRCYEEFSLTEDILMEHAANGMCEYIQNNLEDKKSILIVCGSGNNGADGIALSRLLYKKYDVSLYLESKPKSTMAKLQYKRANALGVKEVNEVFQADVIVDCLFGTGLNKDLKKDAVKLIDTLNSFNSFKISCDIPSGVSNVGHVSTTAFYADITLTMGALKTYLYTDNAKDYLGKVKVINLGVQRDVYEIDTTKFLLQKKDINLPHRNQKNSHKGTYGHLNVIAGCKKGAGIIAAKAAFGFGAGLVSVVCHENLELPYHIMQTHFLTKNCTAIAIGMGLGKYETAEIREILKNDIPKIIDADLFYDEIVIESFEKDVVLTPHPKEFVSLLKLCEIADITIEELQANRFLYVEKFCKKYPKAVLLLKGANVLIGQGDYIFVNRYGSPVLAKGGSGDVLAGLVASLLAQGYLPLDAAISASLAHTLAARNYSKNNYSLIPSDLVEEVRKL